MKRTAKSWIGCCILKSELFLSNFAHVGLNPFGWVFVPLKNKSSTQGFTGLYHKKKDPAKWFGQGPGVYLPHNNATNLVLFFYPYKSYHKKQPPAIPAVAVTN